MNIDWSSRGVSPPMFPCPAAASDFRADYSGQRLNCNAAASDETLVFMAIPADQLAGATAGR
jgi:hypothetical protein